MARFAGLEGIPPERIHFAASTPWLVQRALADGEGRLSTEGALVIDSGRCTGWSPADRRLVERSESINDVDWGPENLPIRPSSFRALERRAIDFLGTLAHVYVVDGDLAVGCAGRTRVRVVTGRAGHALIARNLLDVSRSDVSRSDVSCSDALARSAATQTNDEPDVTVLDAGAFPADPSTPDVGGRNCVAIDLDDARVVILGTEYGGELKKALFTWMNHRLLALDILPLHASASQGESGDLTVLVGLSGSGKTSLAMDPGRRLVGDDELAWDESGIVDLEAGSYARCAGVSPATNPVLWRSIGFGTVLENVVVDPVTHRADYDDTSITENMRACFPTRSIPTATGAMNAGHPDRIVLLTCDAFGVLPPVARLTADQACDHFLHGYTAKVGHNEVDQGDPRAAFSPCYGAPFLVREPRVHCGLLARRLADHPAETWLINTGWTGGPAGEGRRFTLAESRAVLRAIHEGTLGASTLRPWEPLGLQVPTRCAGLDDALLDPRSTWQDPVRYDTQARELARRFEEHLDACRRVPNPASHLREQYHRATV